MKHALKIVILAGALSTVAAQVTAADAGRGEQLLRDRGCIMCHKLNGQGGHAAPDLARRFSRGYTPAFLAGVIWNHAPSGWAQDGNGTPHFSVDQAGDLFAYFSSKRYFELWGDAARGKRVFAEKHCAGCHGISSPLSPDANPVVAWSSLRDPIALAQAMWNRPQLMVRAFARKGIRCPRLTPWELTDLLIYLENLPATRGKQGRFNLASPQAGQMLFQAKGCGGCHRGKLSLGKHGSRLTPVSVAAALWNHDPGAAEAHPLLSYEEMSGIIGYLWSIDDGGNPQRGRRLFVRKKCADCHGDPGTEVGPPKMPVLNQHEAASVAMVTALWNHGPVMRAEMSRRGMAWPRFGGSQMADVAAYLATKDGTVP